MQDRVRGGSLLESQSLNLLGMSGRNTAMSNLLESATNLVKSGATSDVLLFVNQTQLEINATKGFIEDEHDIDQQTIDDAVQKLENIKSRYMAAHENVTHNDNYDSMSKKKIEHQECRSDEALACTSHRRCQWELEELWKIVVEKDREVRETHEHIHTLWCVAVSDIEPVLDANPFNWGNIHPYPVIALPAPIITFRSTTIDRFEEYETRRRSWVLAFKRYTEKLTSCTQFDSALSSQVQKCDDLQIELDDVACAHFIHARTARTDFGIEWHDAMVLYEQAKIDGYYKQEDRKREFETIHIIYCLLTVIHERVERSMNDEVPCITEESDPDQTALDIDTCHQVTYSLTIHLTLNNGTAPELPRFPPVGDKVCSAAYISQQYSFFPSDMVTSYNEKLLKLVAAPFDEDTYGSILETFPHGHEAYSTHIQGGWPGCAAVLVCKDCGGAVAQPPDFSILDPSHQCKLHEDYLTPGESDLDSFRCLDGACVPYGARCNAVTNCQDGSDEESCHPTEVIDKQQPCPVDLVQNFEMDHLHECPSSAGSDRRCVSAASQCVGGKTCGVADATCDGLDVEVVSTSGRQVTVQDNFCGDSAHDVFHDREYTFETVGSFGAGFSYVKTSNDDKVTDHDHVALKVTIHKSVTFHVVTLGAVPQWLTEDAEWTVNRNMQGPTYKGAPHDSAHLEWKRSTDCVEGDCEHPADEAYPEVGQVQQVYQRTFPGGVVNLPGNGGGDGSYLLFLPVKP